MSKVRHRAGTYFILQGLAVLAWWGLLLLVPSARSFFQMGDSDRTLLAFCLPDTVFMAFGSLVAGVLCLRAASLATVALWGVSGAVGYAGLYCLGSALLTDTGWLGVTLMLPATLLSVTAALAVTPLGSGLFRKARPADAAWNLTKTGIQIVAFWSVLLFLVPHEITLVESRLGVSRFAFPLQHPLASALFLCLSALGLWSGYTMTVRGGGTPLPVDATNRLVVGGPYAFVRNPMAVAGLGQGLMVGLWLGSPLVLFYVGLGTWIWQSLVRPLEEDDMARHFGDAYRLYRSRVRCWWPRWAPYRADEWPPERRELLGDALP